MFGRKTSFCKPDFDIDYCEQGWPAGNRLLVRGRHQFLIRCGSVCTASPYHLGQGRRLRNNLVFPRFLRPLFTTGDVNILFLVHHLDIPTFHAVTSASSDHLTSITLHRGDSYSRQRSHHDSSMVEL
jgi:hypothetical protein